MTRQADRNAERQDPKGLGPEGMRAAVCEADAPTTSPMDKTVEVSQAARDAVETAAREMLTDLIGARYSDTTLRVATDHLLSFARFEATTRATQPEAALREALTVELLAFALNISAGNHASMGLANAAIGILERNGIEPRERGLFFHSRDADLNDAAAALKDHRHG